jgi:hypothetical protein
VTHAHPAGVHFATMPTSVHLALKFPKHHWLEALVETLLKHPLTLFAHQVLVVIWFGTLVLTMVSSMVLKMMLEAVRSTGHATIPALKRIPMKIFTTITTITKRITE